MSSSFSRERGNLRNLKKHWKKKGKSFPSIRNLPHLTRLQPEQVDWEEDQCDGVVTPDLHRTMSGSLVEWDKLWADFSGQ